MISRKTFSPSRIRPLWVPIGGARPGWHDNAETAPDMLHALFERQRRDGEVV
jgi:hypothetical protein